MKLTAIAAMGQNRVIGKNNDLIWHLPNDLKHFKNLTSGHHLIMGRKTYESLGKPLPNRINVVVTRQPSYKAPGCIVVGSIQEAIRKAEGDRTPFIAGGAEIYEQALPLLAVMELTLIHHNFDGDAFFPEYDKNEWEVVSEVFNAKDEKNPYDHTFIRLERKKTVV